MTSGDVARDRAELLAGKPRRPAFPAQRPRRPSRESIRWLAQPVALSPVSRTLVVGFDPTIADPPAWLAQAIAEQEGGAR